MAEKGPGHLCPPAAVRFLNSPLRKLIQSPRRILRGCVSPGDTVLDIGCGGGFFAVELARMVGERGRVIAVDVQEIILGMARGYARRQGVLERVEFHLSTASDLGLSGEEVDFGLAFYAIHEVPDRKRLLGQIAALLKPSGRFLLVEPVLHVSKALFARMLSEAAEVGLKEERAIRRLFSRGMLFSAR